MVIVRGIWLEAPWNKRNTEMGFILFGYGLGAAAFYYLIAKTAQVAPEGLTVAKTTPQPVQVLSIAEHYEQQKKAA
jgi:hypothetical protein